METRKEKTKFTKKQILQSSEFSEQKDIVEAVLLGQENYTLEEVNKKIKNWKGKVMK